MAAPAVLGRSAWEPVATAPFDRDIELAVIDRDGAHALVFPCRRVPAGWIASTTRATIRVSPTHWRDWGSESAPKRD